MRLGENPVYLKTASGRYLGTRSGKLAIVDSNPSMFVITETDGKFRLTAGSSKVELVNGFEIFAIESFESRVVFNMEGMYLTEVGNGLVLRDSLEEGARITIE